MHRKRRWTAALCAALLSAVALQPLAQPATDSAAAGAARVIVKFKATSPLLRDKALAPAAAPAARAKALGARLGVPMSAGAAVSDRAQVVFASGLTSAGLAARLAQEADVEYAVPDRRRRFLAAPNDPLYADGVPGAGPAAGQWYLRAPDETIKSSLNAEAAWALSTGDSSVVVAVVDTGVRFDHPDLQRVAAGGNLLPGYDMVSDPAIANDGDGRDGDPSDPGDWVTQAELSARGGPFFQCAAAPGASSWHGTQVSGLVAALTDNGVGMASVGRRVRVLPVRVIGKCGGYDSDFVAGLRWAAGLSVPGVPPNLQRARVINVSLGGDGPCSVAYQQAIDEITVAGSVIVAAAGNSKGHAVGTPANCTGVIAVAGLRHAGTKVGYSALGPEVAVAAPAGNCVNTAAGAPCLYPILTTSNGGTTGPTNAIYTDSLNPSLGTSFAAPLVSGTVALMLSLQPSLAPPQMKQILQGTARAFPPPAGAAGDGSTVPMCTTPRYDPAGNPVDQLECNCTTATCGAGIADAGNAVRAALASATPPAVLTVVEFYDAMRDHYFISSDPVEIATLDAGTTIRGWARTGQTFAAYPPGTAGASPVCRFYIPPALGDSHFFGRGSAECAATRQKDPGFVYESPEVMDMVLPADGVCPGGTVPVYRVFDNRPDANHRYMTDRALRDQMVARGWLAEGDGPDLVVMCAPPQPK